MSEQATRPMRRILGLGFGLAMVFGGTVGVGILRLPGTLAAALGSVRWILIFWVVGGLYALLGAAAVAELAAMMPQAGGFYVYARRAFGNGIGFVMGWSDWFNNVASLAYAAITAVTFLGVLWPGANAHARAGAVAVVLVFTALHWRGLRMGGALTRLISSSIGLMLLILVAACFLSPAAAASKNLPGAAASLPLRSWGMLAAVVTALRAVFVTYDGWYSPIYLAEESKNPTRMLPRALIGGTLVIIVLYVLINAAILRVVPLPVLALSQLPAADAARAVLPRGGAELITVISLLTVLSLVNAVLLMTPRILLAMGRDGMFARKAAVVSANGTPRLALLTTSAMGVVLILSGTFEQIVALAAVLFLLNYISAYLALFVLRRREPAAPRPWRALGYPATTAIVLAGCLLLLAAAILEDWRSALAAALFLLACAPVFRWLIRPHLPSSSNRAAAPP
ncbi:MAG: APC family permease [Pseudomonadota bacterium]|nr:APC family permease [Pseudomonadota bacterium]